MQEYIRKHCINVMKQLIAHPLAHMFLEPVDPDRDEAPGYFDVIKKPMDLTTISKKLDNKEYVNVHQWKDDVVVTFNNAINYNGKNSPVGIIAGELNNLFKGLSRSIVDDGRASWFNEIVQLRKDLCDHTLLRSAFLFDFSHPGIGRETYTDSPIIRKLVVLSITEEEANYLGEALETLVEPEQISYIHQLICKYNPDIANLDDIDLMTLSPETLQYLKNYVISEFSRMGKQYQI